MQITNIAGYKFLLLTDLSALQSLLLEETLALNCRGTILLSEEGINLNVAAQPQHIAAFKAFLKKDVRFGDMTFRESVSDYQPFKHMKVKLKKEIITMHKDNIKPAADRAPSIDPKTFKQWLDEKRDMTILDTRNDYEVRFGTFENAINLKIADFGEFPEAAKTVAQDKPIVMFCTGGIRCEKAGLQLLDAGFPEVYQLEGGILNYFAEVGGDHYQGECFVFDQRISLNADLQETGTRQCLVCQGPIPAEDSAASEACLQCSNTTPSIKGEKNGFRIS